MHTDFHVYGCCELTKAVFLKLICQKVLLSCNTLSVQMDKRQDDNVEELICEVLCRF